MNLDQKSLIPTNLDNDDSRITTSAANPISLSGVDVYYGSRYVSLRYGNVPEPGFRDRVQNVRQTVNGATFVETPPVMSTVRCSNGLNLGNRVGGNNGGRDNSVSWKRVKLWCMYGGVIMPRPPDWAFRYVGGDSKILYVSRNVSFSELVQKIADSCGKFDVLKYQMPGENNLDALVSVVSTDDFEDMMYEYDIMVKRSSDGRARMKVYLFSPPRRVFSPVVQTGGFQSNNQRYIDEVEEIVDRDGANITRTESMANATFIQDSDTRGTEAIASTGHDKVEEVKGIVDGNGASITRNESMAHANSIQDSDLSEVAAIDSTGHEQVDFEEVKGIVDGDGGSITRKESMATATSMHDSDLSRAKAIDSTRHEQEDIEVKRIVDGNGGGISRNESMATATSTQDSDFNEIEAIDSTGHAHGDIVGIIFSGDVSSENNFTASQENVHRLACKDPNPPIRVEPASDPAVGSHPPVLSTQPVAVVQPQQQQELGILPCAPYFQAYADSQQEVLSCAENVQYPSHMGFLSQCLVTDAPVFTQPQKHDNVSSVTPNQFVPVLQMPMTPNSYANTKPTSVQPVTQPQQVHLEHLQEENIYGQRLALISGDQSYNACHAQDSQSHPILGSQGWHQAPQIERVLSSDGFRQQVAITESIPRFEESYICKKALLGAHSDTLAQGQRESPTTTSNFSTIHQSLQPEDKIRDQLVSTAALIVTLAEGIIENQVTEAPLASLSHLDHEGRNIEYGEFAISQYVNDRTSLQRKKDHSHLQALVSHCVEGSPQSSHSVFMGTTPQLYQENVFLKPVVQMQHQTKDVSNSTAVSAAYVGDTSFQVSDHRSFDSSEEGSGKLPSPVSKEGTLEPYLPYDQLNNIDSRMLNLGVHPPSEVSPNNEQLISCAGNSKKDDTRDNKAYRVYNREPHINNVEFMGTAPQLYQENVSQKLVVPMQHKAKEEFFCNTAVGVASVEDTYSQVSDHLIHDYSKEQSGNLSGVVSKEGMLEPSMAYDRPKQIDSRMKNSGVCPSEVLDNKQVMLPLGDSKQKDIMDNRAYQIGNKETCIDNAVGIPQMVCGAKYYKQNEVSYCPSNEVPCTHNEVPCSNQVIQPPLLGINPAQVAKRSPSIAELRHNALHLYSITDSDVEALHNDGDNYISPVNRVRDMQDDSNSLFSRNDPCSLQHNTHFPPHRTNKILTRNTAQSGDPFGDSQFGSSGEPTTEDSGGITSELLTEAGVHLASGNLVADHTICVEEEHIKQELQAVVEGVAASVPQTCIPFGPASQDSKVQNNDEVLHAEDMKLKLPERADVGFPVSDKLGSLQIIKNSDLEELQELGSGTFGTVYYGKWRGSDVAIKRINNRCFNVKPSELKRMREDFWNEAIKLANLNHPNVVAFYGVVLDGPGGSVATVTEYMINGSLRTVLLKNEKNIDMQKRLLIAKAVAFGMEYLHGKNIVHFDIKSDNLLVNLLNPDRPVCKVGDLGLSKVKRQTLISGGVRGTLPWMAPELLTGSSTMVSEKVDVYSFGIVLWELLTGEEPYLDLHYGAIIGGIVNNTLRPPVPDSCDPDWRSLMERCWSALPSERPTFTEVVNQLQSMAAKVHPRVQAEQQPIPDQPQS